MELVSLTKHVYYGYRVLFYLYVFILSRENVDKKKFLSSEALNRFHLAAFILDSITNGFLARTCGYNSP